MIPSEGQKPMYVMLKSRMYARAAPRGLTLIELLAVVAIIGIISLIVIPRFYRNSLDSRKSACYVIRENIEVQAELWYRNTRSWPAVDLGDIASDPAYFPEGMPVCPVDGSSYVLDGDTHQVVGHEHP
jgi:prepilin-type N-terminal cleavage/methylation domain-containing protein